MLSDSQDRMQDSKNAGQRTNITLITHMWMWVKPKGVSNCLKKATMSPKNNAPQPQDKMTQALCRKCTQLTHTASRHYAVFKWTLVLLLPCYPSLPSLIFPSAHMLGRRGCWLVVTNNGFEGVQVQSMVQNHMLPLLAPPCRKSGICAVKAGKHKEENFSQLPAHSI